MLIIMANHSLFVGELKRWCENEELQNSHAFMFVIDDDLDVAEIEEVAHSIKCLGHVRVRGRKHHAEQNKWMVLCECKESVNSPNVPPDILPPGHEHPWLLISLFGSTSEPSDFSSKLQSFLNAEKKSVEDLRAVVGTTGSSAESIIHTLGDMVEKIAKPSMDNSGYRCLRVFSGILPTPASEEQFEYWIEQARLVVEEGDLSTKEKRRWII